MTDTAHAQVLKIEDGGPELLIEWGSLLSYDYLEVTDPDTETLYELVENPPESLRFDVLNEEGDHTGWVIERVNQEWREVPLCGWSTGGSYYDQPTHCEEHAYTGDDEYCLFHKGTVQHLEDVAAGQP